MAIVSQSCACAAARRAAMIADLELPGAFYMTSAGPAMPPATVGPKTLAAGAGALCSTRAVNRQALIGRPAALVSPPRAGALGRPRDGRVSGLQQRPCRGPGPNRPDWPQSADVLRVSVDRLVVTRCGRCGKAGRRRASPAAAAHLTRHRRTSMEAAEGPTLAKALSLACCPWHHPSDSRKSFQFALPWRRW